MWQIFIFRTKLWISLKLVFIYKNLNVILEQFFFRWRTFATTNRTSSFSREWQPCFPRVFAYSTDFSDRKCRSVRDRPRSRLLLSAWSHRQLRVCVSREIWKNHCLRLILLLLRWVLFCFRCPLVRSRRQTWSF